MIEQQLRDGFHTAVTEEPPLGFSPEDVVVKGRKAVHERRTGYAAMAVAALVVAGTAGAVVTFGGERVEKVPAASPVQQESTTKLSKQLGDSVAKALDEHLPAATDFAVKPAAESQGKIGGIVVFRNGSENAMLGYRVTGEKTCELCEANGRPNGEKFTGMQAWRDGVTLTVGSSTSVEFIDSQLGPLFTQQDGCHCQPGPLYEFSKSELTDVVTDKHLALPGPNSVPPGEIDDTRDEKKRAKKQEELERQQYELERELQKEKSSGK